MGVYCGGHQSCGDSGATNNEFRTEMTLDAISDYNYNDSYNYSFNIYCNGNEACQRIKLNGGDINNLYCNGAGSCDGSTISSMQTIYGAGAYGLFNCCKYFKYNW